MRVTVGAIAMLGLAVTVAVAQPPGRERAAELKPPQVLLPSEMPPVARGAVGDFPVSSLPTTPVTRPGAPGSRPPGVASGPAWLTGVDPNVRPASGLGLKGTNVRPLTPPTAMPKDEPSVQPVQPRFIDRVKAPFVGEKSPPPQQLPPLTAKALPQPQPLEQPTASTPYRGTGANGAPVFAGPPAYRWYGWGSVTPGANPLAPTGQYPKASANWYAITGATPGAFPVPVGNPGQTPSGTEPPTYGLSRSPTAPQPVVPIATPPQPAIQYTERPEGSKFGLMPEPKLVPGGTGAALPPPSFGPPPVPPAPSVPTLTPPPLPKPAAVAPPVVPPPAPVAVKPPAPVLPPAPTVPKPDQGAMLPALPPVPPLPAISAVPPVPPVPVPLPVAEATPPAGIPGPLPTSVTTTPPKEESNWQPANESAPPPPGTWAPSQGMAPETGGRTGRAPSAPVVARGQMNDKTPDPIATLIQQMCQGRATGVEVRFTGTKKLQVCFEVRGANAAQQLVGEISKRPELTAYQIDFCVLVK
jgi:hypothetical protein